MSLGRDFVFLKPSEVSIDNAVQRAFDQTHANRLAKDYDPALFGLGHASLRTDGRYIALDAQHRVAAAQLAEQGEIPVLFKIYRGLTVEAEADLFLKLNALKKNVNAMDSFRVGLKAGHPSNVEIQRVLDSFGLRMAAHHADGGISAVVAITHIYHGRVGTKPRGPSPIGATTEPHLLSRTLHILTKAWGKQRDAFDGTLLRGVAAFLNKHGTTIDAASFAKGLAKTSDPARMIGEIRSYRVTARKTAVLGAVDYLENIYNRGRTVGKRLKP